MDDQEVYVVLAMRSGNPVICGVFTDAGSAGMAEDRAKGCGWYDTVTIEGPIDLCTSVYD